MKWQAIDLIDFSVYTFQVNPNKMTPVHGRKSVTSVPGDNGPLLVSTQAGMQEFSFSGVLYTKEQYDDLAELVERRHPYAMIDHLGRGFDVILNRFEPEDRPPRPSSTWRYRYTVTGMLIWAAP